MKRLNHVIYIIGLTILLANSGLAQASLDQKITREFDQERLEFILFDLDRVSDIEFRYNKSILPDTEHSYSFENTSLRQILKIILTEDNLEYYEYSPGKIVIAPKKVMNEVDNEANAPPSAVVMSEDREESNNKVVLGNEGNVSDAIISGTLLDDKYFEPIATALIYNETTGDFGTSDEEGKFILVLAPGQYTIHITSLSHESYSSSIDIKGSDSWDIEMKGKAHYIDEVVVSAKSSDYVVEQTISGLERLSGKEIKQLSSFMGETDLLKSLLTIAGVSSTGDGATGYNVRGGAIDQNLIKTDGAIIFNPFHILGVFSSFNSDIVSNSSLYKGHIPAYHGGRVSSVLDIAIKEADYENRSVKGNLGLLSSKLSLETPIITDKSSLLLSGRASYSKWLLSQVRNSDVQKSDARFHDVYAKYSHKFSQKTKLIGSYLQSFDKLQFANDFGYSWANRIGSIQLSHFVNDQLALTFKASTGTLENTQFVPEGVLAFELRSGMDYRQVQLQSLYEMNDHTFHFGVEMNKYNAKPEELAPFNDSQIKSQSVAKENSQEISIYANDQFDLNEKLSFDVGVRFTIFNQIGPAEVNEYSNEFFFDPETVVSQSSIQSGSIVSYSGLEPRASLRWKVDDNLSLKMSYNRLNQYIHLLSNTTSPTPVDIWQVSNTHLRPLQSDNYSLGMFQSINENIDYSVEAYYRKLDNVIDYRDFVDLVLQPHLENAILLGEGRSFGTELSVSKKGKKLSGRFSYSYSNSKIRINKTDIETINKGEWYDNRFNQPHEVKFFLNWVISRFDRFNINFVYNTGRPITSPISNYRQGNAIIPDFSERNQFRLPSYHRLDISYTWNLNRRRGARYKNDLTFSLYNVYGRKNAFSIFYRQEDGSPVNALRLSVIGATIPSITYGFQF